ncbi:MAG: hypothetical protein GC155_03425 [Alphaproteobacteria bacterium]|nr:hypothetical protein [Alphaproteobacteria bacterium]
MDQSGLAAGAVNPQRAMKTVFFIAERSPGKQASVFIVRRQRFPITETQLQDQPWTITNPNQHGEVGDAWQAVPRELTDYRSECSGSKLHCTRYQTDRLSLSPAIVRLLLARDKKKIRVSFDKLGGSVWLLDANELRAVLDGVGSSLPEATG